MSAIARRIGSASPKSLKFGLVLGVAVVNVKLSEKLCVGLLQARQHQSRLTNIGYVKYQAATLIGGAG